MAGAALDAAAMHFAAVHSATALSAGSRANDGRTGCALIATAGCLPQLRNIEGLMSELSVTIGIHARLGDARWTELS